MWGKSGDGQGKRDRGEEIVTVSANSPWNQLDFAIHSSLRETESHHCSHLFVPDPASEPRKSFK